MFVNIVNGNACFSFVVGNNCVKNVLSVHALSAVFGQQSGVNVDNLVGKCVYIALGKLPQEPCEHNEVGLYCYKLFENFFLVFGTAKDPRGHPKARRAINYTSIWVVAINTFYGNGFNGVEICDYFCCISARTRGKNNYCFQNMKCLFANLRNKIASLQQHKMCII